MAQTFIPNAAERIGSRDKTVPWYVPSLDARLTSSTRQLLETYAKIPASEVEDHVYKIRDSAWQIFPYPCIGGFRFLDLAVADSPDYPQIIERLKTGNENFLDLGCCFGQEIRRLVADGAPSENTYGCDLRQDFFEQGYAFFKDRDTLKSKFIVADIFDPNSGLKEIDGNIDIIYAGSFIHLFGYEQQVEVCVRIAKLLREKPGSLLVGRQIGHLNAGVMPHRMDKEHKMFRHNPDSFQKLWDEVGEKTGTKWRVEGKMTEVDFGEDQKGWRNDEGLRRLSFSVFRL